ncbi:leucine--tRNA ligase [bacterium]|nr:leucine--tRNA ligase [bacterium]
MPPFRLAPTPPLAVGCRRPAARRRTSFVCEQPFMAEYVYDPAVVEKKWQQWWSSHRTNEIDLQKATNPYYVLMMFPYPSAEGLHVGNVYAFTGADVHGRHRRLRGYDVFEPIGFDAFGIHSENFAMKVNRHPAELIPSNVKNFTRQLNMMGFMFDWRRTVDTTSPEYYKWTQWIFLQLYKAGFAYRAEKEVNYCPDCGTVIADEQVNPDGTCERHSGTIVKRVVMPCWFFKTTEFADELSKNHEWLDWSERTRLTQLDWIRRSEGAEVDFQVAGHADKIRVFTTRPDTLFGATFMVLAMDHPLVDKIAAADKRGEIEAYRQGSAGVSPASSIDVRQGRNLPHWSENGGVYHVVFRLADSVPANVRDAWALERAGVMRLAKEANRDLSDEEHERLRFLFSDRIEKYLDAGSGASTLRTPEAAKIVANALKHFDGERYTLHAWCVMPNHVHVVVEPKDGVSLSEILHSWKSFTSKEIAKALNLTESTLWAAEYYDHLIRTENSYTHLLDYVWRNPEVAKMQAWEWRWRTEEPRGRDARATLDKTGVFSGAHAINPVNGQQIPIYISDYVLMGYGTGAIMAVPAHDERDFAFAQKFGLPIRAVIDPDPKALAEWKPEGLIVSTSPDPESLLDDIRRGELCWSGAGVAMNSSNAEVSIDGLGVDEAKAKITAWLAAKGLGEKKSTFRLRDWGISRQRYWGPPIPIIYDEQGNAHPVPEDQLPVLLPETKDFRPKGDGRGPLANIPDWYNTTLPDGRPGRRETDVMDNFLDSAWYFLRYVSTDRDDVPYDPETIKKWLPVDIYIGGNEHAVLHLLYTRFICMALTRAGALEMGPRPETRDPAEPFRKFRAHGLIIKDGAKMSKSKGNVVNPDQYVEMYGADTLRLYLMFLGPYLQGGDFRDNDIQGMRRFLNRLTAWYFENSQPIVADEELAKELRVKTHQTIKKVKEDLDALSYNTAIAACMELFNAAKASPNISTFVRETLILCLAPFVPHFAEEIWQGALGHGESIWVSGRFPEYIESLTKLDEVEIVLQHNGKIKDRVVVAREAPQAELEALALANEQIQKALGGREVKKLVVVPGRLVNVIG